MTLYNMRLWDTWKHEIYFTHFFSIIFTSLNSSS